MKHKAVIFDMDGLILDTEIIEHRSFEKLLKEYGVAPIPHPNGLIHEIGGGGGYFERFKERYNTRSGFPRGLPRDPCRKV